MIVKTFSRFELRLKPYKPTLTSGHPCGLCASVNIVKGNSSDWAFLQTYEEVDTSGNVQDPVIDNDKNNTQKVPFYSASRLSPWSGYSDEPSNNIPKGSLSIYTSFCEVDLNGKPDDASKWIYKMLCNVKWGFVQQNSEPICLELVELSNAKMKLKLKPIFDAFLGISIE